MKIRLLKQHLYDRINSIKGYTVDNVHWIHKKINQMKWDMNLDEFKQWCVLISGKELLNEQQLDSRSVGD